MLQSKAADGCSQEIAANICCNDRLLRHIETCYNKRFLMLTLQKYMLLWMAQAQHTFAGGLETLAYPCT